MNRIITLLTHFLPVSPVRSAGLKKNAGLAKVSTTTNLVLWTFVLVTFVITLEYQLSMMQKLQRFFSVLHNVLSEFRPTISKNVSEVRLLLWTRKAPLKYHILQLGDLADLSVSNYNRSHPTKILIHGFSDEGLTTWVKTFKKKYLNRFEANVISVDWEQLAKSPWYTTAAKNSK